MINLEEQWVLVVLDHDLASREISEFFKRVWSEPVITLKLEEAWMDKKGFIAEEFESTIKRIKDPKRSVSKNKILTLYGDGTYHHYTYGLCYAIAKKKSKDYLYAQIDHHTDARYNENGVITCGSFVENIMEEPGAKDIVMIGTVDGVNHMMRTHVPEKSLMRHNVRTNLANILRAKPQKDVYASLDLDILDQNEILTFYNQGSLTLEDLLSVIEVIKEEKNLISADMLGYVPNDYNTLHPDPKSLLAYATLAANITNKDYKEVKKLHKHFMKRTARIMSPNDVPKIREEFENATSGLRI